MFQLLYIKIRNQTTTQNKATGQEIALLYIKIRNQTTTQEGAGRNLYLLLYIKIRNQTTPTPILLQSSRSSKSLMSASARSCTFCLLCLYASTSTTSSLSSVPITWSYRASSFFRVAMKALFWMTNSAYSSVVIRSLLTAPRDLTALAWPVVLGFPMSRTSLSSCTS